MKVTIALILSFFLSTALFGQTDSKGSFGITFSLPWVNSYVHHDYEDGISKSKTGFVGFGTALYYKQGKNKISFNLALGTSLPAPIGPIDFEKEGTRTSIASILMEVISHRKIHSRVNLIGGINFIDYRYRFVSHVDSLPSYFKKDKTFGLTLGTEYLIREKFAIAIYYRPTIISLDVQQYKHLISLDARFDLNIMNK